MVAQSKSEQFGARLNLLLDAMNIPPMNKGRARWFHNYIKKELQIDVSYEAARKWLCGESIPYTKRLGVIAKGLNSKTEYLIGEEQGKPFNQDEPQGVKEQHAHYSIDEKEIIKRYRDLAPADRARLASIIDALTPNMDKETG